MQGLLRVVRAAVLILSARSMVAQTPALSHLATGSGAADSLGLMRAGTGAPLSPRRIPYARVMFGAVAVSALVGLEDGRMMGEVVRMRASDGRLNGASALVSSLGGVAPVALATALWTTGALSHNTFVRRTGMEATQSVLLSSALAMAIKGLVGRGRPDANPDDPDMFSPGRGFTNASYASFPSAHTSAMFAVATALSHELSGHYPARRRWIRGVLFGVAATVGVSRVYQKAHWPSDVVAGAALGTLSGMYVLGRHSISP